MKGNPQRVAARHLHIAGLLRPPPAMVKAIQKWAWGIAAGPLQHGPPVMQQLAMAEAAAGSSGGRSKNVNFEIDLTGWPYVQKFSHFRDKFLKAVGPLAQHPEGFQQLSDPQRIALLLMAGNSQYSRIRSQKDLQGLVDAAKGTYPQQMAESIISSHYRGLGVHIDFNKATRAGGGYATNKGELYIWPKPLAGETWGMSPQEQKAEYDFRRDQTYDTIAHEMTHFAQDCLRILHGVADAGLPSAKIRTPTRTLPSVEDAGSDATHALLDAEFYTRLADEVRDFLREGQRWALRDWEKNRDIWVAAKRRSLSVQPSTFFKALKKHAPGKWKKAVGIFWEETEKLRP